MVIADIRDPRPRESVLRVAHTAKRLQDGDGRVIKAPTGQTRLSYIVPLAVPYSRGSRNRRVPDRIGEVEECYVWQVSAWWTTTPTSTHAEKISEPSCMVQTRTQAVLYVNNSFEISPAPPAFSWIPPNESLCFDLAIWQTRVGKVQERIFG
ncbi:hypothetical protein C8R44DRAFT_725159 [Mycena epipterygia]|nr:hypothetical protein C8R44DRAFT_725159 [Mycena epipterygia]